MASVSHIPRGRATQRLASVAVYGSGPLAIAAIWALRSTGLIADTPLWILVTIILSGAVANFLTSLLVRARPENELAIHARVAASALSTAGAIYGVGWGSVLLVAYAVGTSELLRTAGPRTGRANLLWNWVAIGAGELAIELGVAPSVIDPGLSHAVAITGAVCLAIVTRTLGESARATEAAEELVRGRAQHFEALIEHAADLIGVVAPDGTIVSVSPAVTPMLGYSPDEVAGRGIAEFLSEGTIEGILGALEQVRATAGTSTSFEVRLRHRDGSHRLVVATLTSPVEDWNGHIILNVHDVTTQRDLEHQLRHDARHDALTGILNRKAFGEWSERACARAARSGRTVGMLYIDLDGFKQINDTFGHDAGDQVLIEAARRIEACLTDGQTVARLGGDEFAVLIEAVTHGEAIRLAEAILETLGRSIRDLPNDVRVGASIGIALRSPQGIEIATLMKDADAAMYTAKRKGRARWEMTVPAAND